MDKEAARNGGTKKSGTRSWLSSGVAHQVLLQFVGHIRNAEIAQRVTEL
jgi:hypothetical protein